MNTLKPLVIGTAALVAAAAHATVVNFDDLSSSASLQNQVYAGLTFNTSTDSSLNGNVGYFQVNDDPAYSTAHSAPNYVYNAWGADGMSFTFGGPVTFNGAWFSQTENSNTAAQVMFTDNLGDASAWTNISYGTSTWVGANFSGATTIWIWRQGASSPAQPGGGQWYTMDDITYNQAVPEPAPFLALGLGGLMLIRRRKSAK